jgi:multidrug efflux pump subunit AcrA (membrane-fusion protein)
MTFEDRIVVSGSVDAKRYALVSARIPGTLDDIYVDEGELVEAKRTRLFQTDSVKLTKAVAIARQDLTVAECSVEEKRALLEKILAAQEQSRNDVTRYRELVRRNAIAAQVLEQQEAQCKQCDADVKHTQALIDLASAQLEQARLNLTIAEKDLADSLVSAPISGRVSQRLREPGEMAGAGTPVLRIEDLSLLEVSVFAPEEYYAAVTPGETTMRVRVGELELGDRPVSYKSPTVHPKLRTFEVEGLVESPPEGVVPGCLAEVTIVADSRRGVGVPAGAVQTRGDRSVLFTVEGEQAKMVPVRTGRDVEGWIEILDGVAAGSPVVSMGQTLVDDGTTVSVVKEDSQ